MIIDITGIELIPSKDGKDCPGNGRHYDADGNLMEWCCDECDYFLDCFGAYFPPKARVSEGLSRMIERFFPDEKF